MISIQFRKYDFRISKQGDKAYIFDEVRKKEIILTPEEWVRQNILHHLIYDLGYPKSRIAVEKEFLVNDKKKRFDILVFSKEMQPFLLVECKAKSIPINEQTAQQVIQYNLNYHADFLVLSNGEATFCYDTKSKKMLDEIPMIV
ncbi:MAG: type I restriction enzyme HsdR N-terminal domain-containing protein [Chitinophagales bacterium]